jgi:hypothetical protein
VVANIVVESLNQETPGIAGLELSRRECAHNALAVETKSLPQKCSSSTSRAAVVVWDGYLLSGLDGADGVDGLVFSVAVPVVVGVWEATVIDEADMWVYAAYM